MSQEEGATQQEGVPSSEEQQIQKSTPTPSAREEAMAAIEAIHHARVEAETGEKIGTDAPVVEQQEVTTQAAQSDAKDDPALKSEQQLQALQDEELILDAEALAKAKVRVKIDGNEELVSAAKVLGQYQKGAAADVRLADATRLHREAAEDREKAKAEREAASRPTTDKPATTEQRPEPKAKIKEALDAALIEADFEKAAGMLADAFAQAPHTSAAPAATPPDTRVIANDVRQQILQDAALAKLFEDYPEIHSRRGLQVECDILMSAFVTNGMPIDKAIAAAGEAVAEDYGLKRLRDTQGRLVKSNAPTTLADKAAKKEGLDEPTGSSARAASTPFEPETAASVIQELKKARGQL